MIEKILDMLEARIRKYIDQAYKAGYSTGTTDAERRMTQMYEWGYKTGIADTMAALGAIDLEEISADEFRKLAGVEE